MKLATCGNMKCEKNCKRKKEEDYDHWFTPLFMNGVYICQHFISGRPPKNLEDNA